MGATYTRQSSATIVDGTTIEAAHFNLEFDALLAAFAASTGHTHDIHLPPLEPATPSLGKVRKMLQIGKDAVSAAVKG